MHRFAVFAAVAAVFLAVPATAGAASAKKPKAEAGKSASVKKKSGYTSRPVAQRRPNGVAQPYRPGGPWNQPWQSKQGWPTSINDGSFSYGGFRGSW